MTPVLEVRNLVKHFPNVEAVRGVSFHVEQGVCFAFGSQWSRKIHDDRNDGRIMEPLSGDIFFRGQPIDKAFRERMGIQFQKTSLPIFCECMKF